MTEGKRKSKKKERRRKEFFPSEYQEKETKPSALVLRDAKQSISN